jgi:hypothetical protein
VVHQRIIHFLTFRRNFNGHFCSIPLFLSLLWCGEIESIGTAAVSGAPVPVLDEGMGGALLE